MEDDMPEDQRIEAARIRDEAAAAAQGDRSAWAHLLDVIHAPDARVKALEEIAQAMASEWEDSWSDRCPFCHESGFGGASTEDHKPDCIVLRARSLYPLPQ